MMEVEYKLVESKDDRKNKVYYTQFLVGPFVFGPEYGDVPKLNTHLFEYGVEGSFRDGVPQLLWSSFREYVGDSVSVGIMLFTDYPSWPKPDDEAKTYVQVRVRVAKPSFRWDTDEVARIFPWGDARHIITDYYGKGLAQLQLDKETEKVRHMASHTCEWMVSEVRDEARKRVRFESRLAGLVAEAQAEAKTILKEPDFRKKLREEPWDDIVDPPVVMKLAEAGVESYFSRWSPLVAIAERYPRLGSDPTRVTTEEAQAALKELTQEAP
jgi:hypothetical protein